MSVWISLYRNFQVLILVIYCLIINVLLFCFLATAHLDYHIVSNLSTTFLKFFKIFYFSFKLYCRSLERLLRIPNVFSVVNNFFKVFSTFFSHTISCIVFYFRPQNLVLCVLVPYFLLFNFNKDFFHTPLASNQLCHAPASDLLFLQLRKAKGKWIFHLPFSAEGGIRTHVPFRTNGFQDRLVMTSSIPLQLLSLVQQRIVLLHTFFILSICF